MTMPKKSNTTEVKTDKPIVVKTEKKAPPTKFKLKEGFKPITGKTFAECCVLSIYCSSQMCLLVLRKKDHKTPAFVASDIKWAGKNLDREFFKDKIFDCLYGAGDILGEDGIPLGDNGAKKHHEVAYYFAL